MVEPSNGENLPDVMLAVNQMESAPLVDAEWAEDHVRDATARTEEVFRFVEEIVDSGQVMVGEMSEIAAADRRGRIWRSNLSWGCTAFGKDSQGS